MNERAAMMLGWRSAVLGLAWAFSYATAAGELPAEYTEVLVDDATDLNGFTSSSSSDKIAFLLSVNVAATPETNTSWKSATTPFTRSRYFWFGVGDAAAGSFLSFSDGPSGVFYAAKDVGFDGLDGLAFSRIAGKAGGGAMMFTGSLTISNIVGRASDTAAAEESADVLFDSCGVVYSTSSAEARMGGAIYAKDGSSGICVQDNGQVHFLSNFVSMTGSSALAYGGAIYSCGALTFARNQHVLLQGNKAEVTSSLSSAYGGALYAVGLAAFDGNDTLTVSNNRAVGEASSVSVYGGGFYVEDQLVISRNHTVVFAANAAASSSKANGGAIYMADTSGTGSVEISNNGSVRFQSNRAVVSESTSSADGGAIYAMGDVIITGNRFVVFEDNYTQVQTASGGVSVSLNALNLNDKQASLILAAPSGGSILFKDPVNMISSSGKVSFNAAFADAEGTKQQAAGDIIFSGAGAAERLAAIKGAEPTADELTASVTSNIDNTITLAGGTLQVVDGAVLKLSGLTLSADSGAKLLLRDAAMAVSSNNVSLGKGSTLVLEGHSSLNASKVILADGVCLDVLLDESHRESAALSLSDKTLQIGQLNIVLNRYDHGSNGRFLIFSNAPRSHTATWDSSNVSVQGYGTATGADFSDLLWEGNALYYVVQRLQWAGESAGGGTWDYTSSQWTQNDSLCAYSGTEAVYFGDTGAGEVLLASEVAPEEVIVDNSAGHDYVFSQGGAEGKLTGDTSLIKTGDGSLTLATANDYSGETLLLDGTLVVQDAQALGLTEALTSQPGSTLQIDTPQPVVLSGDSLLAGAVVVNESAALQLQGGTYQAERSEVYGVLSLQDTRADAAAGTLSGSGSLVLQNGSALFQYATDFQGNLSVLGEQASLTIQDGTCSTSGDVAVLGNGAELVMSNSALTLESGGSLALQGASLRAQSVCMSSGATLSALATADSVATASTLFNSPVGGTLQSDTLTLLPGSRYEAVGSHLSLAGGTLVLAGVNDATAKVVLTLDAAAQYTADAQVLLFSEVGAVDWGSEITEATSSDDWYTVAAADYFGGSWINAQTLLIYDRSAQTVYLEHVATPAPEPTSCSLALIALALPLLRRRRR